LRDEIIEAFGSEKERAMYEQAWLALHSLFLLEFEAAASRE
jgi:hypothetical protein